jgi:UDP-3-O-[3-hydroxymyristoyl] N-acetylglucosamine deacetylase
MIVPRRTVSHKVIYEGIGLQTGKANTCVIAPANSGDGIVFCRLLPPSSNGDPYPTRAHYSYVDNDKSFVSLRCRNYYYYSVEHILALLYGYGITDATIYLDNGEVPADIQQISRRLFLSVKSFNTYIELNSLPRIFFKKDNSSISFLPYDTTVVSCYFEFLDLFAHYESYSMDVFTFFKKISGARSFCTKKHVENLQSQGWAKGVNSSSIQVFNEYSTISADFVKQECVRHKILDFLGDLSLSGKQVSGIFMLKNPSHSVTREFVEKYLGE